MTGLGADDFGDFFQAVHGHAPFTWQHDLLRQVDEDRRWPEVLRLPTGSGKTAVLDVALFALALDAQREPDQRWAPRRVVLVVDRRLVVDQAHERAVRIRKALKQADLVLSKVTDCLRELSGGNDDVPVQTGLLRGAVVRDELWARRPDLPTLLAATVDQVGSRLLFRGYGVSRSMRPVHAGLLGTDALIALDEVHLSQPFAQTLRSLVDHQARPRPLAQEGLPRRWHVVEMSATPQDRARRVFPAGELPLTNSAPDLLLRRRLQASKPVVLQRVSDKAGGDPLPPAVVQQASGLLGRDHVRTLLIIVNRVDTARTVAELMSSAQPDVPVELLTGRMRPVERDALLARRRHQLMLGERQREQETERLVLVGTQCLEAGADIDADALVTECASLAALRQRLGRVDRDGILAAGGTPAPVVVLARADDLKRLDDPVYGPALPATWQWLSSLANVDGGVAGLPVEDAPAGTAGPQRSAPLLLAQHISRWSQTSPTPAPDAHVGDWLHGQATELDVNLVWRVNLDGLQPPPGTELTPDQIGLRQQQALDQVNALPPVTSEAVTVPLRAVRQWLLGTDTVAVADVEGARRDDDAPAATTGPERVAVRWASGEGEVVPARALRPGDLVVVPSSYGGLTRGTWDPSSLTTATDVGLEAAWRQTGRVTVRLTSAALGGVNVPELLADPEDDAAVLIEMRAVLAVLAGQIPEEADARRQALLALADADDLRVRRLPRDDEPAVGVAWSPRRLQSLTPTDEAKPTTEPATSSFTGRRVTLEEHLLGVGAQARTFATRCGLPSLLASDVALAARLHDLGKLDPRFQRMLADGAPSTEPLAKSGIDERDRGRRRHARRRAGLPDGFPHEMLSVALVQGSSLLADAHDPDLVLHLIASHHGACRPLPPPIVDDGEHLVTAEVDGRTVTSPSQHGLSRLDSGVADRFWRLQERYGPWGLAWLEALLRLADHTRSAEEQAG